MLLRTETSISPPPGPWTRPLRSVGSNPLVDPTKLSIKVKSLLPTKNRRRQGLKICKPKIQKNSLVASAQLWNAYSTVHADSLAGFLGKGEIDCVREMDGVTRPDQVCLKIDAPVSKWYNRNSLCVYIACIVCRLWCALVRYIVMLLTTQYCKI